MKAQTWAEQVAEVSTGSISRQVGAIPLLYPLLERLQVRQIINGLVKNGAQNDVGRVVEVLTLNRVVSPQPLSRVGEWVGQSVVEKMFDLDVSQLYDNRLGRALDDLQPILAETWLDLVSRTVLTFGSSADGAGWPPIRNITAGHRRWIVSTRSQCPCPDRWGSSPISVA